MRIRPSGADTWFNCPGQPHFTAKLENKAGEYAAEGSVAHSIRQACLELGMEPWDFVGQTIQHDGYSFEVTTDMASFLQGGIDRVRSFEGALHVELSVDLSAWLPGQSGTLDAGIVPPPGSKTVVISDLKYGSGVSVSPVMNTQQMIYALGFYDNVVRHHNPDVDEFLIIIDQPRIAAGGGEWRVSLKELRDFGKKLKAAGKAALDPKSPRIAGEKQCHWCIGKATCPEFHAWNMRLIALEFDQLDEKESMEKLDIGEVQMMTKERKSIIARHKGIIEKWLQVIYDEILADAVEGRPTPGVKAVMGRQGNRAWANMEQAEATLFDLLGDRAFNKKLISPAQVEKMVDGTDRDLLRPLVKRGEAKPVLVPDTDDRPAILPMGDLFDGDS
jgi:hypothetical protein